MRSARPPTKKSISGADLEEGKSQQEKQNLLRAENCQYKGRVWGRKSSRNRLLAKRSALWFFSKSEPIREESEGSKLHNDVITDRARANKSIKWVFLCQFSWNILCLSLMKFYCFTLYLNCVHILMLFWWLWCLFYFSGISELKMFLMAM